MDCVPAGARDQTQGTETIPSLQLLCYRPLAQFVLAQSSVQDFGEFDEPRSAVDIVGRKLVVVWQLCRRTSMSRSEYEYTSRICRRCGLIDVKKKRDDER